MPLPGAADRHFARFCRTGDPRALAAVFDRTAVELLRIAAWLSGDAADAEDLLQRTFLTAIEQRASFRQQRRVLPWLCGILTNHARNLRRERGRRQRLARAVPAAAGSIAGDPVAAASAAELGARLAAVRAELGPVYGELLALHLEQGFGAHEIAARLGRKPATVRTQLARALGLLRRRLPRGFVAGLLPPLPGATAIAAVKAQVLAALPGAGAVAEPIAAAAGEAVLHGAGVAGRAGGAGGIGGLGGLLVSKKLAAVAAGAAAFLFALAFADGGPAEVPAPEGGAPGSAGSLAQAGSAVPRPDPAAAADRRELSGPEAAPAQGIDNPGGAEPGFATLRVAVTWGDGSPAAAVGVHGQLGNEVRAAVTDARGECLLRHLPPGSWRVAASHGERARTATVRAGGRGVLALSLGEPVAVRGLVADPDGRPVADAVVWLANEDRAHQRFAVATSGADGRFAVQVAGRMQLGARKAGHAPSAAVSVEAAAPVEPVLRLGGPGGSVAGTVRDQAGRPLPWARVLVGPAGTWREPNNGPLDEVRIEPWGRTLLTGPEGGFLCDGTALGRLQVRAWAPGHAPQVLEVEAGRGAPARCDFALLAGASVHGVVTDGSGRPVPGAAVSCGGEDGRFVDLDAVADEGGRYRLVDLPPGRRVLHAAKGALAGSSAGLELAAGGEQACDLVLRPRPSIRGVVLGPDGGPRAGWWVGTWPEGLAGPLVRTAADGTFELWLEHGGAVTVAVGATPHLSAARVGDVRSGTADLCVRVGAAPAARLSGRVVDAAGRPLAAQVMALRPGDTGSTSAATRGDGTFELGPLPEGPCALRVSTRAHGFLALPPRQVPAVGTVFLGDLVLREPGGVRVLLRDPDGEPCDGYAVFCGTDRQWVASVQVKGGAGRLPHLQPGPLWVTVAGGRTSAAGEVLVVSGGEARVELQLQENGLAELQVDDPSVPAGGEAPVFQVVARTRAGRFAGLFGNAMGAATAKLFLPPGEYALEVFAADGRTARGGVAVPADGSGAQAGPVLVRVGLPPR